MMGTVAAMKGRLGDTDYYILSMKAQALADAVKIPKELEGWEDISLEERYQRDLNYGRVKKQIAPYFANDDSRFFGAIIVAAMNFNDDGMFEKLSDVVPKKDIIGPYKPAADTMGFLTFRGGEVLVPLDGQHRLKAIQFAVTGRDERGRDIPDIPTPCTQLAQEDVTVILVPYESTKARRIFTRVNRYAKPTTTGQNIVTDDDDFVAVLAREVTNDLISARLVKYASNTLNSKDPYFTTLSIVYNCNDEIIKTFPGGKIDKTVLPSRDEQRLYRDKVREVWEVLLENIEVFASALADPESTGDDGRRELREQNLLGKPVAQECLVRAFMQLTSPPTNYSPDEACEHLNGLPWEITNENLHVWDRVLWSGGTDGRIITKNRNLLTDLVAYLAGKKLTEEQRTGLLEEYRSQFPEGERPNKHLPQRPAG